MTSRLQLNVLLVSFHVLFLIGIGQGGSDGSGGGSGGHHVNVSSSTASFAKSVVLTSTSTPSPSIGVIIEGPNKKKKLSPKDKHHLHMNQVRQAAVHNVSFLLNNLLHEYDNSLRPDLGGMVVCMSKVRTDVSTYLST